MVILKISERLGVISQFVIEDSITADIGTDHGYLIKYLLDSGKISKGIACDLNKKPLAYAEKNLKKYLIENKAEIRLGSGLLPLNKEDNVQCVVIAGMGGKLMTEILEEGRHILYDLERIILSPNIAWEKLRKDVINLGFKITDEDLVLEDDRFYPIIVIEKGEAEDLDYSSLFLGPRLIEKRHHLLKKFYEFEKEKVLKNAAKMKKSKDPETEKKIIDILKKWEEMSRCIDEQ